MKLIALAAVALIAAQSGKPLAKAGFEEQQAKKYARYDGDKDGKLTPEELMRTRPNRADGSAWTLDATAKWLVRRDGNGDGTITTAEAVAFEMPRFEKMDANKDGSLSAEERANEPK